MSVTPFLSGSNTVTAARSSASSSPDDSEDVGTILPRAHLGTSVRHAPTLNPDDDGKLEHSLTNRVPLVKHVSMRSDAIQIDTKRKLLPYPLEHT